MRTMLQSTVSAALCIALSTSAFGQGRVFIAELGADPAAAPAEGPMAMYLQPGECRHMQVWVQDASGMGPSLHDYSIVLPWEVHGGGRGQIEYLDIDPQCNGHTVDVDTGSRDWVFALQEVPYRGTKMERSGEVFGVLHHTLGPGEGVDLASADVPNPRAPNYLGDLAYCASADACGSFEIDFISGEGLEFGSVIRTAEGADWPATWQPLQVIVGDPAGQDCAPSDVRHRDAAYRPRGDSGAAQSAASSRLPLGTPLPRAWMTRIDADPSSAPTTGTTTMQMLAGTCATIAVWLEDTVGGLPLLNSCQIFMPWSATGGDSGTIAYLDNNPGAGGGDSILMDTTNPDWTFALEPVFFAPVYNETPTSLMGTVYNTFAGMGVDLSSGDVPNPGGPNYFTEFTYCASADASGTFDLNFNRPPSQPPLTACFGPICGEYHATWQPFQIEIVECLDLSQCADQDANGIRDDPCTYYDCIDGACVASPRGFLAPGGQADMGGFSGACAVDGVCDAWDYGHALKCFANTSTMGTQPYECEPDFGPAPVALNVDAGSIGGSCVLDGVCDLGDVNHAVPMCFGNHGPTGIPGYPCPCPAPPQPGAPAARPAPAAMTGVTLSGPSFAKPGEELDVDVYIDAALGSLQSYQLHLMVSGGEQGRIVVADLSIDPLRADYAFANSPTPALAAFNVGTRQMLNTLSEAQGVATPARAYLATVSLAVSADAQGDFVVDLLHDELSLSSAGRTFLLATPYDLIGIERTTAARVHVVNRARGRVSPNP